MVVMPAAATTECVTVFITVAITPQNPSAAVFLDTTSTIVVMVMVAISGMMVVMLIPFTTLFTHVFPFFFDRWSSVPPFSDLFSNLLSISLV